MARKRKFGSHTLMKGDITPLTEKVVETVENRIYSALKVSPTPKFLPIPPRTFLEKDRKKITSILFLSVS